MELLGENEIMDDIWFEDVENNHAWFMCLKKWKHIYIDKKILIILPFILK